MRLRDQCLVCKHFALSFQGGKLQTMIPGPMGVRSGCIVSLWCTWWYREWELHFCSVFSLFGLMDVHLFPFVGDCPDQNHLMIITSMGHTTSCFELSCLSVVTRIEVCLVGGYHVLVLPPALIIPTATRLHLNNQLRSILLYYWVNALFVIMICHYWFLSTPPSPSSQLATSIYWEIFFHWLATHCYLLPFMVI